MIILGIETSCDDTSVAVVKDGREVLSNLVSSQTKIHQPHGGVVPELASRRHAEIIDVMIRKALGEAQISLKDVDAIAVTYGPGLEGALIVGLSAAKALGHLLDIPVIGVNHMHGHIAAHYLGDSQPEFPFLALIVSGGHTQLVKVSDTVTFELLGETRDDAAGEAFDKVARVLGLSYPGGPIIEKTAKEGDDQAFKFPIGLKNRGLEFSFSGLKTAVIQTVKTYDSDAVPVADICASFQKTVIQTLWEKSQAACEAHGLTRIALCGGVSANRTLQDSFQANDSYTVYGLEPLLCTDNAAMIAAAGYYYYQKEIPTPDPLLVKPGLTL